MTDANHATGLSAEDMAEVDRMAQSILDKDKDRYTRVMEEIAKEEGEILARLRQIRIRRAAVQRAGHYGK